MIGRVKLWLWLAVILAALAAGFGLRGCLFRGHRQAAEQERERLQAELKRVQQRIALTETDLNSKRKEIVTLREKSSGRKMSPPTPDCRQCFAQASLEIEVRDEKRGWWIFHDRDVLDREPGELTLTPKFWEENLPLRGAPEDSAGAVTRAPKFGGAKRWRTEKEIRAGINLTGYEAEVRYTPLLYTGRKWQAGLSLGSRLEMDRLNQSLHGDISVGFILRR